MSISVGIIPARYASTRLKGKPLISLAGKPMIQWVYEKCTCSRYLSKVIVATDDERIGKCVEGFGGEAVLTSSHHRSGTDRVAEVVRRLNLEDEDVILNIQGDEPLINTQAIDHLARTMLDTPQLKMATLAYRSGDEKEWNDSQVVKVVVDSDNFALYFSRASIPYFRECASPFFFFKHLGIYAYRKDFLLKFNQWSPTPLEKAEHLEQLRVLEKGYRIKVIFTDFDSISVDTPQDLEVVKKRIRRNSPLDKGGP